MKQDTNNPDFRMVVSMSYWRWLSSDELQPNQEVLDLYYARGDVLFLAAAAGDTETVSDELQQYPAGHRNVISVAAMTANGLPASSVNFNPGVELAAPGVEVLSTVPAHEGAPLLQTSPAISGDSLLRPPPIVLYGSNKENLTGGCSSWHAKQQPATTSELAVG